MFFSSSVPDPPTIADREQLQEKVATGSMISQGPETQLALSTAVDRLTAHAAGWSTARILDEGLDLVRDCCWADGSALHSNRGEQVEILCQRPALAANRPSTMPAGWFPWGLAPVSPRRFLFVENAAALPFTHDGSTTLGDVGVSSVLHLPILERQQPIGALHLYWAEPRLVWDDDSGRILRSLGRFLLSRAGADCGQNDLV